MLQVLDLGLARTFCDYSNVVLQRRCTHPLSRFISVANGRYASLPPATRIIHHLQFRSNAVDSQAGISANLIGYSVQFIWLCLLGLLDGPPNDEDLFQTALKLDVVKNFVCSSEVRTMSPIQSWKISFSNLELRCPPYSVLILHPCCTGSCPTLSTTSFSSAVFHGYLPRRMRCPRKSSRDYTPITTGG